MSNVEAWGNMHRVKRVQPWVPARPEFLGDATGQATANEVGKPIKLAGITTALCASGDEIYGVVESLAAATSQGYSVVGALCDPTCEFYGTDEAGTLAVGDLVVAGTTPAFGTASPATGPNVIAGAPAIHRWQVMAKYVAGANAGSVLLRKL